MENNFSDENINFTRLFQNIFVNIYFIIGSSLLIFLLFLYIYINSERVWRITSLIEIDENSSSLALDFTDALSPSSNTNLDEQMVIYTSNTNIRELVKSLQLDIEVYLDGEIVDNKDDVIKISDYSFPFKTIGDDSKIFSITKNELVYELRDEENVLLNNNLQLGQKVGLENSYFVLESISPDLEGELQITFLNPIITTQVFKDYFGLAAEIESNYSWDRGNLIRVSVNSSDIDFATKVLNTANEIYKNNDIKNNALEAERSLDFIDVQIEKAREDLEQSELELNNFQKIYGTINVDLEIEGYIEEVSMLNERIRSIRIRRVELESIYSQDNIQVKSLIKQEDELNKQLEILNNTIENLPETQQQYINLFGEVQINKTFYQELLSKKLEVSIIKASTLGSVNIIDDAYVSGKVSPSGSRFAMLVIILSGISAFLIVFVRSYLFRTYNFPAAFVEDHKMNFLGVVEKFDDRIDGEDLESFRAIAENLLLEAGKKDNCKVLQIVGATPKVGKSTIARNIAKYFASIGKKTILLDLDFRRGDQHIAFNLKKIPNLDVYYNPSENLSKYLVEENLVVIPRKKNGAQDILPLTQSNQMDSFFEYLKDSFDYIIIDNAPTINIPDSISLSRFSDLVIAVARHKSTKARDVRNMEKMFEGVGCPIDASVYNSFKAGFGDYYSDYYSYTYSYGYKYYDSTD